MPEISVEIKNIHQIKAAFGQSPKLMTRGFNTAIRKSVLVIGRDSRKNTPVDTGRLRASTLEEFSNLKGVIGTHTEYDAFVHEGTRYMRARPYLKQAVESNQHNLEQFFTEELDKVLSDIGRKT